MQVKFWMVLHFSIWCLKDKKNRVFRRRKTLQLKKNESVGVKNS